MAFWDKFNLNSRLERVKESKNNRILQLNNELTNVFQPKKGSEFWMVTLRVPKVLLRKFLQGPNLFCAVDVAPGCLTNTRIFQNDERCYTCLTVLTANLGCLIFAGQVDLFPASAVKGEADASRETKPETRKPRAVKIKLYARRR